MRSSSASTRLLWTAFSVSLAASAVIAGCSSSDSTVTTTPGGTSDASADTGVIVATADGASASAFSGTIGGNAFAPTAQVSGDVTSTDDAYWDGTTTSILLTTDSAVCADLGAKSLRASTVDLFLQLSTNLQADDAGGFAGEAVTGAGTFPITTTPAAGATGAQGEVDQLDAMCSTASENGKDVVTSGTVTITARTSAGITGSLDITTMSGVHLTGSFSTTSCGNLAALGGDGQACAM